jgi:hypothetical protein
MAASTPTGHHRPALAQLVANHNKAPSQRMSGCKSGALELPGCLRMSDGVANARIKSDTKAQPRKFSGVAPCQVTGSFVGCQSQ